MKKIDVILTVAVSLGGKVVQPSDEPIAIEEKLAAQLIGNGRAKLPEAQEDETSAKLAAPTDAEIEAVSKRIEQANAKAEKAEKDAQKRIDKASERVGEAEVDAAAKIEAIQKDADEKIAGIEKSVKDAETAALEKIEAIEAEVEASKSSDTDAAPKGQQTNSSKGDGKSQEA